MKHLYKITGMTCNGCLSSVQQKIETVDGVTNVSINLESEIAEITMDKHIPIEQFKAVLPEKYSITVLNKQRPQRKETKVTDSSTEKSKLQQLKPLLLIFLYIFGAAFLLNYKEWNSNNAMLDFMGLFYIVFSFFKFLDLKGFPESFRMYDPLAKVFPIYGWIYPFIELVLGLLFLMRFKTTIALLTTIVVLGITTIGVTKSLLDKKSIRCACLGTALKLPMTEATFIENAIMLIMAVTMLIQLT
ncbi:heavy-metal-associated domain-containing protein [Aurantibacter sp.]|uniref:heavy-metal-associated domain-containing protein n=1 Tax=Aurantibacter sp. TaxID=2807103 RepID=UPI003264D248